MRCKCPWYGSIFMAHIRESQYLAARQLTGVVVFQYGEPSIFGILTNFKSDPRMQCVVLGDREQILSSKGLWAKLVVLPEFTALTCHYRGSNTGPRDHTLPTELACSVDCMVQTCTHYIHRNMKLQTLLSNTPCGSPFGFTSGVSILIWRYKVWVFQESHQELTNIVLPKGWCHLERTTKFWIGTYYWHKSDSQQHRYRKTDIIYLSQGIFKTIGAGRYSAEWAYVLSKWNNWNEQLACVKHGIFV